MIRLRKINQVPGVRLPIIRSFSNHYDALGVTPKSTQSEIKTAYYKLSKVYHPDKSTDETSAKKFRAITEAYEVLGNVKLKNMYDRGFLGGRGGPSRMTPEAEPEPTDPSLKFFRSRHRRHVVPTMDGKTPIYDFDTWAKNHYSTLYEKSQYEKDFIRKKRAKQVDAIVAHNQELGMVAMLLVLAVCFVILSGRATTDYDQDRVSNSKRNEESENATPRPIEDQL